MEHLKVCDNMSVTCLRCDGEVANKDKINHDCILALKSIIAKQQHTINKQDDKITKLESELKDVKLNDSLGIYT